MIANPGREESLSDLDFEYVARKEEIARKFYREVASQGEFCLEHGLASV